MTHAPIRHEMLYFFNSVMNELTGQVLINVSVVKFKKNGCCCNSPKSYLVVRCDVNAIQVQVDEERPRAGRGHGARYQPAAR